MQYNYFQYDYAEMQGTQIRKLGILFYQSPKPVVSIETLREHTKQMLNKPDADIYISGVSHVDKATYDEMVASWKEKV